MAKISIVVEHPALVSPKTKTFTVNDADMTRVIQALKIKLRKPVTQTPNGTTGDAEPLTNAEALDRATKIFWDMLRQLTRKYEEELAAAQAVQNVPSVEAMES